MKRPLNTSEFLKGPPLEPSDDWDPTVGFRMKHCSPENLSLPRPQIQSESSSKRRGLGSERRLPRRSHGGLRKEGHQGLAGVPCSLEGVVPWWVSPLEPTPGNDNLQEMRQIEASSGYQKSSLFGRAEELRVEHASGSE